MYGLTLVGVLLILGLFTRLASLGGLAFVLLFYLRNPPFVGYFYSIPNRGQLPGREQEPRGGGGARGIFLTGSGRFAGSTGFCTRSCRGGRDFAAA